MEILCPLKARGESTIDDQESVRYCDEECCGWWADSSCAIVDIAKSLDAICDNLTPVAPKDRF